MKKLKAGLIGAGEVAQIIHLPILKNLSDRYEIAALCDISPQLLAHVGGEYGISNLYTDAMELVVQSDLDVVFILNSDEYHAECAIAAARNGKHVFIEKPVCLTKREADEIIKARDEAGVKMMVGYMRRYAAAFTKAAEELKTLGPIQYARVRDLIGDTGLIIEQSSVVHRYADIPEAAKADRADRAKRMVQEAIGDVAPELVSAYRLLCGLNSHDLSAMRELIGMPKRVIGAAQWNAGRYITALLEFDGFVASFETGVDKQRRFDAHLEVYGITKSLRVQYNSPYIRHLPTTIEIQETVGDAYTESVERPTFKDAYTIELETWYDVITQDLQPKTSIEDYKQDLELFRMIIESLKANPS